MTKFLVSLPIPEAQEPVLERILKTATSYLEATGTTERHDVDLTLRVPRKGKPRELLAMTWFVVATTGTIDEKLSRARALEDVLRTTLRAAGLESAEVRVGVERMHSAE